jgi:hypothetical protein
MTLMDILHGSSLEEFDFSSVGPSFSSPLYERGQPSHPDAFNFSNMAPPSDTNSPNPFQPNQQPLPALGIARDQYALLTATQRVAFGQRMLKKVKISEERTAIAHEYFNVSGMASFRILDLTRALQITHPEERDIFRFVHGLSHQEEMSSLAIETAKTWSPSTENTVRLVPFCSVH